MTSSIPHTCKYTIDRHGLIIEVPYKIAILGEKLFLDLLRHISVAGGEHRLGAHHQHREAVCFLQIFSQQKQYGLKAARRAPQFSKR